LTAEVHLDPRVASAPMISLSQSLALIGAVAFQDRAYLVAILGPLLETQALPHVAASLSCATEHLLHSHLAALQLAHVLFPAAGDPI
jgi:hypothetical protein